MRKFIITHTRPNADVPFYKTPPHLEVSTDELLKTGAMVSKELKTTALQQVVTNTWRSIEDAASFTKHPLSAPRHAQVDDYNARHGIVKTLEIVDTEE